MSERDIFVCPFILWNTLYCILHVLKVSFGKVNVTWNLFYENIYFVVIKYLLQPEIYQ